MSADDLDRSLAGLKATYDALDIDALVRRAQDRLAHMADDPGERERIDGLARRAAAPPIDLDVAELLSDGDVCLRILGDVTVARWDEDGGTPLGPLSGRIVELLVYLALRRVPVSLEQLVTDMFPATHDPTQFASRRILVARLLTQHEVFASLFERRADDCYQLSDRVVTDYDLFDRLVGQAEETNDAELASALLQQALGLVRGRPLGRTGARRPWISGQQDILAVRITEAAEELAELRLVAGDPAGAEWAVRQGRRASPTDERLRRLLMHDPPAADDDYGQSRVPRTFTEAHLHPRPGIGPEEIAQDDEIEQVFELLICNEPDGGDRGDDGAG